MRETKKTKFYSNQEGITLIALVITIIVLLLLAGVSISMLSGENGILKQANEAKTTNEDASIEEQVKLAVMASLISSEGGVNLNTLNEELGKIGFDRGEPDVDGKYPNDIGELPATVTINGKEYKIDEKGTVKQPSEIEKIIASNTPVGTKTTLTDEDGKTIVIPEGFKLASDSATKVKDGIVVIAPDQSEFVWVPVEKINSMVMCQGSTGANNCNIQKTTVDGKEKLVCSTHNEDICGRLYANSAVDTMGDRFSSTLTGQKYTDYSKEPGITSENSSSLTGIIGVSGDNDTDINNNWKNLLQEEYEKMALSVYENKGFYVGRYETSLDTEKNRAKSVKNVSPFLAQTDLSTWVNYRWYHLFKIDKEYSEKEYDTGKTLSNVVGSSMIWGSQYDQMMIWMQNNGCNVKAISETDKSQPNKTKITGSEPKDILNNVYDLLGCWEEYTLENYKKGTYYGRVSRGHSYSQDYWSASYRRYIDPNQPTGASSRITLYIK